VDVALINSTGELWLFSDENISKEGPLNCRSLDYPGFPVGRCDFGQLHVVLFTENHISGAVESGEVGNPGTLGGCDFFVSLVVCGRKAWKNIC
jgi:hypothetical protein